MVYLGYIYPHLVDVYGKCRYIYHTWILWVRVLTFVFDSIFVGPTNYTPLGNESISHLWKEHHVPSYLSTTYVSSLEGLGIIMKI